MIAGFLGGLGCLLQPVSGAKKRVVMMIFIFMISFLLVIFRSIIAVNFKKKTH